MTTITLSAAPRPLGRSDIMVSPIAWGMWRLAGDDIAAVRAAIDAALAAGITLFDTADIYGADQPAGFGSAEVLFGRALAEAPALREAMV
ncbi:aldo/keto reductase, partial [Escherichia coli]|nr:aldo/keto reductase [Escherichia coli]